MSAFDIEERKRRRAEREARRARRQQGGAATRDELFSGRSTERSGGSGRGGRDVDVDVGGSSRVVDNRTQQQVVIDEAQDESAASLQRTLQNARMARDTGADTLVQLQEQGEQLDRMQDNADEIHGSLKKSKWLLRGIKSVGGAIRNAFGKKPDGLPARSSKKKKKKSAEERAREIEDDEEAAARREVEEAQREARRIAVREEARRGAAGTAAERKAGEAGAAKVEVFRVDNEEHLSADQQAYLRKIRSRREKEDESLDQISSLLGEMAGIGKTMGAELESHNERLDRLGHTVDTAEEEMAEQNRTMRKILR